MRLLLLALLSVLAVACAAPWRDRLRAELPTLGHRNWIVIADSAYPWQSNPGIETLATGASQLDVVRAVLDAADSSAHVRPAVYLDAELAEVSETDAPGIEAYRRALAALLGDRPVQRELLHEAVIARLDQDATLYRVLILKTNLALPYTTVFVRLECGYWSAEAEQRLRAALGAHDDSTRTRPISRSAPGAQSALRIPEQVRDAHGARRIVSDAGGPREPADRS